jgi:hypothetical protein
MPHSRHNALVGWKGNKLRWLMIILFILVGSLVGAGAAAFAFFSGGSFLFALLCYSVFGSLSGSLAVIALFMRHEAKDKSDNWVDTQKASQPVSA